ncbi:hypothetical protein EJ136_04030 [Salmonella enterica]|nr:hypothetical protein [Salmonella enterica]EAM3318930.1 hypothetical protein [Salmonella enterica]EAM5332500.1 hypothetical protein [Salmonella enterica]EAN3055289.1 hypothetical protein [Salmonella enterica]EAN4282868.1 hypothetical protein [Salmonella enterica]
MPCGLSVLHRTYPDHHLGWRELNPRPKFLHTIFTLTKTYIYFLNHYVIYFCICRVLWRFKALPPMCRHYFLVFILPGF